MRWCSACPCSSTSTSERLPDRHFAPGPPERARRARERPFVYLRDFMNHPILGAVALGYAPLIDRQRMVLATHLTVIPLRPDAKLEAAELLAALAEVWPAGGAKLVLGVLSEDLLESLLATAPSANLMLEVPAFMAADARHAEALLALKKDRKRVV